MLLNHDKPSEFWASIGQWHDPLDHLRQTSRTLWVRESVQRPALWRPCFSKAKRSALTFTASRTRTTRSMLAKDFSHMQFLAFLRDTEHEWTWVMGPYGADVRSSAMSFAQGTASRPIVSRTMSFRTLRTPKDCPWDTQGWTKFSTATPANWSMLRKATWDSAMMASWLRTRLAELFVRRWATLGNMGPKIMLPQMAMLVKEIMANRSIYDWRCLFGKEKSSLRAYPGLSKPPYLCCKTR